MGGSVFVGGIFAITSQKGGVGKTTTTLNLAYSLSRFGERVLAVDGDPQGGLAISSNLKKRTRQGLVQALRGESRPEELVVLTRSKNLGIIGFGAMEHEDILFFEDQAKKGNVARLLQSLARIFDYTFIDVPAGVGSPVIELLRISERVILLIQPKTLSVRSLPSSLKLIQWIRRNINPGLRMEGILFTMVDRKDPKGLKLMKSLRKRLHELSFFRTVIPFDERYEDASRKSIPIEMLVDGRKTSQAYESLVVELKEKELLSKKKDLDRKEIEKGLF